MSLTTEAPEPSEDPPLSLEEKSDPPTLLDNALYTTYATPIYMYKERGNNVG